jgi:predicted DNA-binding transcriptional regulator AlpA
MYKDAFNSHTGLKAVLFDTAAGDVLIPLPEVAKGELGRDPRTLRRWLNDPRVGFPKPVRIQNRLYFSRRELEAWKTSRVRAYVEAAE